MESVYIHTVILIFESTIMSVYRTPVILLVFFLTCVNCMGQEAGTENGGASMPVGIDSIEAQIVVIRNDYNKINAGISKFRVVKEDMEGQSTEGGQLIRFYEGKSLRKVKTIFYGETGKAMTEYYFLNNSIIFSFKRTYYYDMPIYEKGSKVNKVEEERFYFNKLKLIRWVGPNGKTVKAGLYGKKEKEIMQILNDNVYNK